MTDVAPRATALSADQPCREPSEDLLGYAPFARMLAHSVLRGSPAAGLVVGIYGEWGLGKTSLLNFIEHYATADAQDQTPLIVRFNPWWFSGREDLFRRFFKEFEGAVLRTQSKNKTLLHALQKLGDAVATVPVAWAATMGKVLTAATKLAQPSDVVGLKEALVQALGAEALRVIVLVDDVDRLLPSEMTEIFRLVRSVADFPNVHYVLAFDREVVAKALRDECHTDGNRYLEKIIQAPFDLPRPSGTTLQGLFTARLQDILADTQEDLFDRRYWGDVFLNGIARFLRTPRDATRLANSIAVLYPAVRNEVNPVDFVAIETLRVFEPRVYEIMRSNQSRFVGLETAVEHLRDENQKFHEHWLQHSVQNQLGVRALVLLLFPAVGSILAKNRKSSSDAQLRRARRICTDELFQLYFRYSLEGGLSRSAFISCMESTGERLGAQLDSFGNERLEDGRTKLRWFLGMLHDDLSAGKRVNRTDLVQHLCRLGDTIIQGGTRAFGFNIPADLVLVSVVAKLLEGMPAGERASALKSAFQSAGVAILARLIVNLGAQHGRHGESGIMPEERTIPSAAELHALEEYARRRIEQANVDGSLWRAPNLVRLLFDWRLLGGEASVREAARIWTSGDDNLIALLSSLKVPTMQGYEILEVSTVSALLDLEQTARRVKNLLATASNLDARARITLQLFVHNYSATGGQRADERARRAVLSGVLETVADTGCFPTQHTIRTRFEEHRDMIDRLLEEKVLGHVMKDQYMITVEGLRELRADTRAERELRMCAVLVEHLQAVYRTPEGHAVELDQLAVQLQEQDPTVNTSDLQRATFVLLRMAKASTLTMTVGFDNEGLPNRVGVDDGILDFSADDFIGLQS